MILVVGRSSSILLLGTSIISTTILILVSLGIVVASSSTCTCSIIGGTGSLFRGILRVCSP